MKNLTHLRLSGNELTGAIPARVSPTQKPRMAAPSRQQVDGFDPPELAQLKNLTELWLYGNELTGAIPAELAQLKNLKWLSLHDNKLTGAIPAELAQLKNLNLIDGSGAVGADRAVLVALYEATGGANWEYNWNWLSAAPLDEWYGVTTDEEGRVWSLGLSGNELTGCIPAELAQLKYLTQLRLGGNELTGCIPVGVSPTQIPNTTAAWRQPVDGVRIPVELAQLEYLTELRLDSNELTGAIPAELGQLENLTHLGLFSNRLTGCIPVELAQLEYLTELRLDSNRVDGGDTSPS